MNYRVSGHETFAIRYAWLPKAVRCLRRDPHVFADEDLAMVELGVGKNMVRSIRFWSQVAGVTTSIPKKGYSLTDFGVEVLGPEGFDPFLEDVRTLWLLHWQLSTNTRDPLLAWDFLLNRWHEPEILPSRALRALHDEALKQDEGLSRITVEKHLDMFFHTYLSSRGKKGEVLEDNLDCPLVELGLIVRVGTREIDRQSERREPIYAFRREAKPEITSELFSYCLHDFWAKQHPNEATLTFDAVAHGHGSPGQIFKLPEDDIRVRAESLREQTGGCFEYVESATMQQFHRKRDRHPKERLEAIYARKEAHVS